MIIKNEYKAELANGTYPDLFASEKEKRKKGYIKATVDYFYGQALRQYFENQKTFSKNYKLLKGMLSREDFYETVEDDKATMDFVQDLTKDQPLPSYVRNFSIMNQPINTLRGENSERPDNSVVKAFDNDSKSEELAFRTELLNQYVAQVIQEKILQKAISQGVDLNNPEAQEQIQQLTMEKVNEELTSFTTSGEKWANHVLEALKMEFNTKDQSDDAFLDLLVTGRERYHVYEDRSKTGFKAECVNPKNVFYSTTPNKKYLKDAYAGGIIEVMEISEILDKFNLTKEEVDALKDEAATLYNRSTNYTSNLFTNATGTSSIKYNTEHPYQDQEQMMFESALFQDDASNIDELFFNIEGSSILGQKHPVLTVYSHSKKKVGLLTYIDQDGVEQTTLVDENYKEGSHPQEIEIIWGYDNQWWKHVRIGGCVYLSEPFELLPYFPIIGIDFEKRNSEVKGMVDLLAPFQAIVNVCFNQLWELLQKEKGVLYEFNPRKIPVGKDETFEEAVANWMHQAEELGYIFSDDSPENMQAPTSNTNVSRAVDLTRSGEMASRLQIIQAIKLEAHSIVGITPERLGGIAATQTVAGTNAALSSSFSQTAPWFEAHDQVLNQFYQAIVDAAQYIESKKELSTISYINALGENCFIQVAGSDLLLRDFRCFVTSRSEDSQILEQVRSLAQPMLQNGADFTTVAKMYISNSLRDLQNEFKKDKERREKMMQQQQATEQQTMQMQQQQAEMAIQAENAREVARMEHESYNKQLDRINKLQVATLNAAGRDKSVLEDADNSGVADALEITRQEQDIANANRTYELSRSKAAQDAVNAQKKLQFDQQKSEREFNLKQEELRLKEKEINQKMEDSRNKLKIARTNKNRHDK